MSAAVGGGQRCGPSLFSSSRRVFFVRTTRPRGWWGSGPSLGTHVGHGRARRHALLEHGLVAAADKEQLAFRGVTPPAGDRGVQEPRAVRADPVENLLACREGRVVSKGPGSTGGARGPGVQGTLCVAAF